MISLSGQSLSEEQTYYYDAYGNHIGKEKLLLDAIQVLFVQRTDFSELDLSNRFSNSRKALACKNSVKNMGYHEE